MKEYKAELYYGFCTSEGSYDIYHAFELTDPDNPAADEEIEEKLAALLDTDTDDENFECRSMYVKLPDSVVERIRRDFFNQMVGTGKGPEEAYGRFQLLWMLAHGDTISDIVDALTDLQYEDPEDSDVISTPVRELFKRWELDVGFGGEIWPCFREFKECEYKEGKE